MLGRSYLKKKKWFLLFNNSVYSINSKLKVGINRQPSNNTIKEFRIFVIVYFY